MKGLAFLVCALGASTPLLAQDANHNKNERSNYLVRESEIISASVCNEDVAVPGEFKPEECERIKLLSQKGCGALIEEINTPRDAAIYCTRVLTHGGRGIDEERYGITDFWESLKETNEHKIVDCDAAAIAAASLLSDNGFRSYILTLTGKYKVPIPRMGYIEANFGHAIFLYKTHDGKYGSIGINDADVQKPDAESIDEFIYLLSRATGDDYDDYNIYEVERAYPDFASNSVNNDPRSK